jgi:hypothetical protein
MGGAPKSWWETGYRGRKGVNGLQPITAMTMSILQVEVTTAGIHMARLVYLQGWMQRYLLGKAEFAAHACR